MTSGPVAIARLERSPAPGIRFTFLNVLAGLLVMVSATSMLVLAITTLGADPLDVPGWPLGLVFMLLLLSVMATGAILRDAYTTGRIPGAGQILLTCGLGIGSIGLSMHTTLDQWAAETRVLDRLRPLPARLPYRATTDQGLYTGTVNNRDLTCGTLQAQLFHRAGPARPSFFVISPPRTDNDALETLQLLPVTSLQVDPAAVKAIRAVPDQEQRWLWTYLHCSESSQTSGLVRTLTGTWQTRPTGASR